MIAQSKKYFLSLNMVKSIFVATYIIRWNNMFTLLDQWYIEKKTQRTESTYKSKKYHFYHHRSLDLNHPASSSISGLRIRIIRICGQRNIGSRMNILMLEFVKFFCFSMTIHGMEGR